MLVHGQFSWNSVDGMTLKDKVGGIHEFNKGSLAICSKKCAFMPHAVAMFLHTCSHSDLHNPIQNGAEGNWIITYSQDLGPWILLIPEQKNVKDKTGLQLLNTGLSGLLCFYLV